MCLPRNVDRRTELSVYISSEFCWEASNFIFLEGGTPSKSLGKRKTRETQVNVPEEWFRPAVRWKVSQKEGWG